jgi:hypothetical protein
MTLRAWLLYWFIHVALRAPDHRLVDHRLVGSRPRLGDWLWLFFSFFFLAAGAMSHIIRCPFVSLADLNQIPHPYVLSDFVVIIMYICGVARRFPLHPASVPANSCFGAFFIFIFALH